jgi:hypothetical protein
MLNKYKNKLSDLRYSINDMEAAMENGIGIW